MRVSTPSEKQSGVRPAASSPIPHRVRRGGCSPRSTNSPWSPNTRTPRTGRRARSSAGKACTPLTSSNGHEHATQDAWAANQPNLGHRRNGRRNQQSRSSWKTPPAEPETDRRLDENPDGARHHGKSTRSWKDSPRARTTISRRRGPDGRVHRTARGGGLGDQIVRADRDFEGDALPARQPEMTSARSVACRVGLRT